MVAYEQEGTKMSVKTEKIRSFLQKEAFASNDSADGDKEQAWLLLMEMLKQKNLDIHQDTQKDLPTAQRLAFAKKRLRDIKQGLNLSLKSGVATKTIH